MNTSDAKQNNRNKIYLYIRKKGFATKQDIAFGLKLSLPTVTQTLTQLVNDGMIKQNHKVTKKSSGRRPIAYFCIPDGRVAIGLDITKRYIKSVVVNLNGDVIKYINRRQDYQRTDEYLSILGEEVQTLIESIQLDSEKILGIAIAVPGLVDHEKEYIFHGKVIDNEGMSCEDFARYIPYPTRIIHDLYASGFFQIWFSKDIKNAFYFSLANAVGGSVIINNNIYLGDGLYSGEIGHFKIVANSEKLCYCGKKGCLDIYCNSEVLANHTGGDLEAFFNQLKKGNKELDKVWDEYLDYLTIAINGIRMLFGCTIIIGGYIGAYIKEYMDSLYKKVDAMNPFGEKAADYLMPCRDDIEAVAVGAALSIIDEYLNSMC